MTAAENKIHEREQNDSAVAYKLGVLETKLDAAKESLGRIEGSMAHDSESYARLVKQYELTLRQIREGRK